MTMCSFLSKVAGSLASPLMVGNSIIGSDRNMKTDGKISSTVLVACVLPVVFVIIITYSVEPSIRKPSPVSWGLTEFMFAFGSISAIFLSISAYKRYSDWIAGPREKDLSQKPRLLFFWLFGFCIIVDAALNLSINIDCILKDGREPFPGEQALSVLSHFVEIAFFASQLGFIAYFINFRFFTSVLLNYGMSVMLMTHLVVWFHSVVSSLFRHHIIATYNYTRLNDTDCFWDSDINHVRVALEPYIAPAQIEYSLLSASFLLKMWSVVNKSPTRDNITDGLRSTGEASERTNLLCEDVLDHSRNATDPNRSAPANINSMNTGINSYSSTLSRTDNVRNTNIAKDEFSEMSDALQMLRRSREKAPLSFYIVVLVGIALTIPVIVAVLILMTVRQSSSRMRYIWMVINSIFTCLHFSFLIVAFCLVRRQCRFSSSSQKLKSKDQILILSAAGSVAYGTFSLLSGVFYNGSDVYSQKIANVVIFGRLIDIVGVYLQTVLIIYSGRRMLQEKESPKVKGIENVFLLLLITNFVAWFAHSFITSRLAPKRSDHHGLSSSLQWPVINEVIFPFVIFYRFHSFMDMYERYRKFKMYLSGSRKNDNQDVCVTIENTTCN